MALPGFNEAGDLPEGICRATLEEVTDRFRGQNARRHLVTERLLRIHQLAAATGELERFIIFSSEVR